MNDNIFLFFYNFSHQGIFLDKLIVFFAQTFPYLVVLIAVIFLLYHHEVISADKPFKIFLQKWKEIILVFFTGIFAWCLAFILKNIFQTQRPFDSLPEVISLFPETGYGFPSGHATFYMALAVSIYLTHKKAGYFFIFFALLIGIARIAGGVHSPIDILGGYILGIFTAYLVRALYKKLR